MVISVGDGEGGGGGGWLLVGMVVIEVRAVLQMGVFPALAQT